ncbi:hypothetical protein CHU93_16790 [Sandarakinorhabdus cyanobacteriorum]|uniref:DUF3987 domain-containing protein n=1 Tax=Sandarakinorhabdus cyanobacteriorum TaxID=1981098 RepID=A0A255Y3W6_9SPHN|nr:YfjI family protein [Sandarakinorhabdus cyanobacteriorum]OYQ23906.1 hypothetical protein CHU93_16790 [Sandarakinorhabdus cyanobacteriorum]
MHNQPGSPVNLPDFDHCVTDLTGPSLPERLAKLPLFRELPPGLGYPVDALPKVLSDAVSAIVDLTQCQPAIAAGSVLAVSSLAAQAHANVLLPHGATAPLSLYLVTIAESGDRKSAADVYAMRPVRIAETDGQAAYRDQLDNYKLERESWDGAKAKIIRDKALAMDPAALKEAIGQLGRPPKEPLNPSIIFAEPTMAGLQKAYHCCRPSLGLFSDEGGQMLGGHALRDESRLHTIATLNDFWQGSPINRTRAGDGHSLLLDRRLALHLMIQPGIAHQLLGNADAIATGLTARLLVAAPPSLAGSRHFRMPAPESSGKLQRFTSRVSEMLSTWPHHERDPQRLMPRSLPMAPDAQHKWISFHDDCQTRVSPIGVWKGIRPWGEKAPEQAARLAGVIAVVQNEKVGEIGEDSMAAAITIAEFYGSEMLRLAGQSSVDSDVHSASDLLQWLRKQNKTCFHLAEVYQLGPNNLRTAKAAQLACQILETHGEIVPLSDGLLINGKRHRRAWMVVPD